jgi:GT2 family glycosyltransferase/glycosyltransferase involved in cell wall biosynthesis
VVIPTRDSFAATMAAITALHAGTRDPLELIVIDRGSSDETQALNWYLRGGRVVRFDDDIGRIDASNAGWQLACAPYVLFLAADSRLAPGSVARARQRLEADASIGAVAGLVVRPRGTIAQAGGIVWADGGVHHYQRGQSSLAPEANFVRDTDFGSLACLMVRRSALDQAGGLDGALPEHHAAADLCLRLAEAGLRTVYDPSVMVVHDDGLDAETAAGPAFVERHASALAQRQPRGGAVQVFARHAGQAPHRILFIDDTVPLRRLGSGFVRSNDLVRQMAALGCAVTVYPVNGSRQDPAHIFGDMPETAEVMHTHGADRLKEFLEGRKGYYDTIWVCRTHNLSRISPVLERLRQAGSLAARIVLDTEAVTPQRDALQARLTGQVFDLEASMRAFVAGSALCDAAVAVSASEARMLRAHGMPSVTELGHMMQPRPSARGFAERNGMLFVGAIHKQDSPNYDSLAWFVEEVLPKIDAAIGWQAQLTIAGYVAPGVDTSRLSANPRVSFRGPVADLTPLYNRHRVFVAPTRFAAGVPYKVLEAAAHGLPVVATSLLAEELGWQHEEALLSAPTGDAEAFAQAVLALHGDESLWKQLRISALEHLARDYDEAGFVSRLRDVLRLSEDGI